MRWRTGRVHGSGSQAPPLRHEDRCVACGLCVDDCPQVGGNEFDVGLKARKAIYRPFPQSVPAAYVIDSDACLNFLSHLTEKQKRRLKKIEAFKRKQDPEYPPNILPCGHCSDACDVDAIDFDMLPRDVEIDVGSILVAVGFQEFDARKLGNYGYGRLPNVVTSLELERMLNASGVTRGHVVRPSDMETPRRVVFIQCVGARGEGGRPYCSRFCCMNAVKDSMLMRQHDPGIEEITILYTDIRAFGKGFDEFVERSLAEQSATYIRGRPAKVDHLPQDDSLEIFVEDTLEHSQLRIAADLVVLSVAAAPNDGAIKLAEILGIETDAHGFIARRDPAVSAVESTRDGIFVCGSAVGPQVIPDCVAQASATAARAELYLAGHRVQEQEKPVEPLDLSGPPRVGVMVCHCGVNIGGVLDVEALAEYAGSLPDVTVATSDLFSCSSTGQDQLVEMMRDHGLNRIVVAACTPRTHEPVFREALARIGFNPFLFEMANIRDQCSWVHAGEPEAAQEKARALIRMAVARARHLEPLQAGSAPMRRAAVVIGGGIGGIQAASDLAVQGFPVTLVEKTDRLGGRLAAPNLNVLYPNLRPATDVLEEKIARLELERSEGPAQHRGDEHRGFRRQLRGHPSRRGRRNHAGGGDHPGDRRRSPRPDGGVSVRRRAERDHQRATRAPVLRGRRARIRGRQAAQRRLHPVRRIARAGRLQGLLALLLPDRDQTGHRAPSTRHRHHGVLPRHPHHLHRGRGDVPGGAGHGGPVRADTDRTTRSRWSAASGWRRFAVSTTCWAASSRWRRISSCSASE